MYCDVTVVTGLHATPSQVTAVVVKQSSSDPHTGTTWHQEVPGVVANTWHRVDAMGNPFFDLPDEEHVVSSRVAPSWRRVDVMGSPVFEPSDPGLASVVSMAMGVSWAARSWDAATGRRYGNVVWLIL